jgi:hypothetical protein
MSTRGWLPVTAGQHQGTNVLHHRGGVVNGSFRGNVNVCAATIGFTPDGVVEVEFVGDFNVDHMGVVTATKVRVRTGVMKCPVPSDDGVLFCTPRGMCRLDKYLRHVESYEDDTTDGTRTMYSGMHPITRRVGAKKDLFFSW